MNYIDDFWAASRTLERQDKGAKDQAELPGLEKQFGKAHLNQLEAQRKGDLNRNHQLFAIPHKAITTASGLRNTPRDGSPSLGGWQMDSVEVETNGV